MKGQSEAVKSDGKGGCRRVWLVEDAVCRGKAGDDHEDLQEVREDVHAPGGGAALAGLLPGMPGEVPAGGNHHEGVPPLRKALRIPVLRQALAEIL